MKPTKDYYLEVRNMVEPNVVISNQRWVLLLSLPGDGDRSSRRLDGLLRVRPVVAQPPAEVGGQPPAEVLGKSFDGRLRQSTAEVFGKSPIEGRRVEVGCQEVDGVAFEVGHDDFLNKFKIVN